MADEPQRTCAARARLLGDGHEELVLSEDWHVAGCPPGDASAPRDLEGLAWLPARVPGTVAGALRDAGLWSAFSERDLDAEDWWFRTRFQAAAAREGEEVVLALDGIATVAEVFLNGQPVSESESMFLAHEVDVGAVLEGENELVIRCAALAPLLAQSRKPRARWRTALANGNLRFQRTMLLGRAPGFAPTPAAIGPWRTVRVARRRAVAVQELALRPSVEDGGDGVLGAVLRVRPIGATALQSAELCLSGPSGTYRCAMRIAPHGECVIAEGELRVRDVARWWPHTHGEPVLHEVRVELRTTGGRVTVAAGRTGFRTLAPGAEPEHDVECEGLDLHVNGQRVFARGAVWTPVDLVGLAPSEQELRATLERVRNAGMNMVRIPGTAAYESDLFHDLCDELGVLVWQDFMFANLDYPIADARFRELVRAEAETLLDRIGARPSTAVLCGNSEVEQQVAMLGLDHAIGRGELFGELLPGLIARARADAIYVPSAPCGGARPFATDRGVANYYGVGGYRRPLSDARRAEVRFASECLAFSNVPDEAGIEDLEASFGDPGDALAGTGPGLVNQPGWKAGVPRDAGATWDFEDVRDHYLQSLYGLDPCELRRTDPARYLELSRFVGGEVMAEVFGEWRRADSPCGGGLVLWLKDLAPGAGWGMLDARGRPKAVYHHLRRALAPVTVWTTDEGLNGIAAHVANDLPTPLRAALRAVLYRDGELPVGEAVEEIALGAHESRERDVEEMLGHFADVSYAYRFGPAAHDALVVSLERIAPNARGRPIAQAFRFPSGAPLGRRDPAELGLSGSLVRGPLGELSLSLSSRRLAYGVRIHLPGLEPADDSLCLEPRVERTIALRVVASDFGEHDRRRPGGWLTAINMHGSVPVAPADAEPAAPTRAPTRASAP